MQDTHPRNHLSMSGNVQGFDIPRGCLMTSGAIALPVVTFAIGLARSSTLHDVLLAFVVPGLMIAGLGIMRRTGPKGPV